MLLLLLLLGVAALRVQDSAEMFSLYSSSSLLICFSELDPVEATVRPSYEPSTSKLPGYTPRRNSSKLGASLSVMSIMVFSGMLRWKWISEF